eukprot:s2245_g3.t1
MSLWGALECIQWWHPFDYCHNNLTTLDCEVDIADVSPDRTEEAHVSDLLPETVDPKEDVTATDLPPELITHVAEFLLEIRAGQADAGRLRASSSEFAHVLLPLERLKALQRQEEAAKAQRKKLNPRILRKTSCELGPAVAFAAQAFRNLRDIWGHPLRCAAMRRCCSSLCGKKIPVSESTVPEDAARVSPDAQGADNDGQQ